MYGDQETNIYMVILLEYIVSSTVQSFAFKLTALRSTFLCLSIGFSLTTVVFYMEKTVQYNVVCVFSLYTLLNYILNCIIYYFHCKMK
jgi:hypothetical protein